MPLNVFIEGNVVSKYEGGIFFTFAFEFRLFCLIALALHIGHVGVYLGLHLKLNVHLDKNFPQKKGKPLR